ncbi:Silicatein [Geodia barretti]|uniref:Silicatein n=1 Tax=Geodia barretti TaxID=519541 RepID=A0AA35S4M3_GEOBA|nr:Silicatein [Geodia barretti]
MERVLVLGLILFGVVQALVPPPTLSHAEEWQMWKTQHGKSYGSVREELERHLVWLANREYINAHNQNSHIFGFTLAMNHLGDITNAEYNEMYMTYRPGGRNTTKMHDASQYSGNLPESVDWRTNNAVTSIKDQGYCGASYAFSAVGALEGANALATGTLISLSEQNIIDCSIPYGNHGCKGGNMYDAFLYMVANDGIDTTDSYPYKAKQMSCSYTESGRGATTSGSVAIESGNENDLQSAVAYIGPVAVAVDAQSNAFRYYKSGVYSSTQCSSSTLTHAMVVTGYGTYSGTPYYLVKNSYGANWGMNGYILMARNKYNQCGIASDASYPTL